MQLRDDMITVFGASGFIGRYVVRRLAKAGYRVRAATRRPHLAHELKPMGVVGQIQLVQANLRDSASVSRAIDGAQGVVNLVGILAEGGRQTFQSLQADGAGLIAETARRAGIGRFVQVSAIGADAHSKSRYARTKAQGEAAVLASMPGAVVLRPSIVFGPEDGFFNRFADMARFAPALPLIGGGVTKFQPVYCDDVALCVVRALEMDAACGRVFELGGPSVYSFRELMEYILKTIDRQRLLIPVPFPIASLMGLGGEIAGALPFVEPFLTRDQVTLLRRDNVAGAGGTDMGLIDAFGVTPESVEAIVPSYLARYRKGGQFAGKRKGA
ncbi:MAG: NAD-dependent epimerase/dehydratase family protein [Alphaproteobacteria bacterium]|nr:NAD-dependent epimerase/dehydratase family protein [Alphaproteobacteria bacterium]